MDCPLQLQTECTPYTVEEPYSDTQRKLSVNLTCPNRRSIVAGLLLWGVTKVTPQDKRSITRAVKTLRRQEGANFTSGRIKIVAGVTHLSNRTVRRVLNQSGFRYLKSRKKGLLNAKDLQRRCFVGKCSEPRISFYLDAKGSQFKTNPQDQARAPRACQWRTRS